MNYIKILSLLFLLVFIFNNLGCSNECYTEDRYLVVRPYAGLANRLRVLASAKIMAVLTDRHLVVDWSVIPKEMPAHWKDLFLSPLNIFENSDLAQTCSLKAIKNAHKEHKLIKNLGSENGKGSGKILAQIPDYTKFPIVYYETSLNFSPRDKDLDNNKYRKYYSEFYKNLDPVKFVFDSVNKFKKENKFEDYFMIGVHYRSWQAGPADDHDNLVRDKQNKYVQEFIDKMKAEVAKPQSETNNKPVGFFLAADNSEVKKKFMNIPEFKNKIFTRSENIERDTILGQQSAMVDWYLLGAGEFLMGTYQSSFSDEAAHITTQNRKIDIGKAAYVN